MYDSPLNALRALVAVYESGGVRPAARLLDVAHSSVSRHLVELEKWLGVALFERTEGNRSLVFTPQGEALGQAGLKSLKLLTIAVRTIREAPRQNSVVISTTPSVAALWLLPRLSNFQRAYPWVELSVVAEQKLVDPAKQAADIALRMGKGPWPAVACDPLMDDDLYPVMSRAHWESVGKPSDPNELKQLRLLHDRDPNAAWEVWLSAHGLENVDTQGGPRFGSSDLVLRAAAQGLGVALARARLAATEVENGSLVKPFGNLQVNLPNAYWIIRSKGATQRAAVSSVVSWLKSQTLTAAVAVTIE